MQIERFAIVALGAFSLFAADARVGTSHQPSGLQIAVAVNEADCERHARLGQVRSRRKYTMRNKDWDRQPVMIADITSAPGKPSRFEIVSFENAGKLQRKVFTQILEGEVELSVKQTKTGHGKDQVSIAPHNYDFEFAGREIEEGRELVLVRLIPKHKSKYLLAGQAWIDPSANALVRVKGTTAASLSFWVGKAAVDQSFKKVQGAWMPATSQSVASVKFLGDTALTIEFSTYQFENNLSSSRSPGGN